MKNKIIKTISILIVGLSLFTIKANAESYHWMKYENWDEGLITWVLLDENNIWHDIGWYYENGEWYYVSGQGLILRNPGCVVAGNYEGYKIYHWEPSDNMIKSFNDSIDDKYYFDEYGHMLHDCYIYFGSPKYKYWINSTGEIMF